MGAVNGDQERRPRTATKNGGDWRRGWGNAGLSLSARWAFRRRENEPAARRHADADVLDRFDFDHRDDFPGARQEQGLNFR